MSSKNRYVNTGFWDDKWIIELTPKEKLLFLYLLTNPLTNIAGIYEISIRRMMFDTGLTENDILKALKGFERLSKVIYLGEYNYIILINFLKHQKMNPKMIKGVETILENINPMVLQFLNIGYNSLYIDYAKALININSNLIQLNINSNSNSNSNSNIEKDKKVTVKKNKYGEHKNVLLTEDEYNRLLSEWGEEKLNNQLKIFSNGLKMKDYKYKDHNLAIRKWESNNNKPQKQNLRTSEGLNAGYSSGI